MHLKITLFYICFKYTLKLSYMIPKILHQFWIGTRRKPEEFLKTWESKYEDWQYILWDEQRLAREFANGLINQYQYDNMPELNGKCDIARWEILDNFGGFFVDADSVCINKIDNYLLENNFFASYENEISRPGLIAAGYVGSTKNNPLLKAIINEIGKKRGASLWHGTPSAWKTVGPFLLTQVVNDLKFTDIAIYPSFYFIPRHFSGVEYTGPAKIYADQYWGSTVKSGFNYEDVGSIQI